MSKNIDKSTSKKKIKTFIRDIVKEEEHEKEEHRLVAGDSWRNCGVSLTREMELLLKNIGEEENGTI